MLGYPPRPTSILPKKLIPNEWLVQPKYRGWRAVIHDNKVYTRKGNLIDITTNYPEIGMDYQLDAEIVSTDKTQTEHKVRRAIKNSTWKLEIFDVFLPKYSDMVLTKRLKFLKDIFNVGVTCFDIASTNEIIPLLISIQKTGYEGIVLKQKNSTYLISKVCEIVDPNWVKLK